MAVNFCSLRPLEAGEPPGPQARIPQVEFGLGSLENLTIFFFLKLFTFPNFSVKVFVLIAVHAPHSKAAELPCSRDDT